MRTFAYRLVDEHDCIRQARVIGLFGCADLVDTTGPNAGNRFTTLQGGGPSNDKVLAFKKAMLDEGIISLFRNWYATAILRSLALLPSSPFYWTDSRRLRCRLIVPAVACYTSHHR